MNHDCADHHHRVLVINTGSASTKIAVYEGCESAHLLWSQLLEHSAVGSAPFDGTSSQLEARADAILKCLAEKGEAGDGLDAVVARGGALRPMPGGVYLIDEALVDDVTNRPALQHAANYSPPIAFRLASERNIPAYLLDPITVDEFEPLARFSGLPQVPRLSRLHALSVRSTARKAAEALGHPLTEVNIIVAHLGSGISIAAVKKGRMVDVNGADDEGPFSPERSGSVCASDVAAMCFSGEFSEDDLVRKLCRRSGLLAHLGTADARDIEKMIQSGDTHALVVSEAMFYGIAKEIGAMATVLSGDVDAIAITGGLAHWPRLVDYVTARCKFLAPIQLYPGENEMEALATGALRALVGLEPVKRYEPASGGANG